MEFPSSSRDVDMVADTPQRRKPGSTAAATATRGGLGTPARQPGSQDLLFLPESPMIDTLRPSHRGEIRSSITPSRAQPRHQSQVNAFPSSAPIVLPSSTVRGSNQDLNSLPSTQGESEDLARVIWGTNVSLSESMASFSNFLRSFKVKYRTIFDRERGVIVPATTSFQEGERILYEDLLRKMRLTGQTNLNLDVINLQAFPPTRKLHSQLIKYPQEIVPVMDQVLKDLMIALAEEDATAGMEGMVGDEGEDEVNDIMGKVYKIRPWGGEACNMRDLNPTGTFF
jgi:DNA replication licensing factor MCM4